MTRPMRTGTIVLATAFRPSEFRLLFRNISSPKKRPSGPDLRGFDGDICNAPNECGLLGSPSGNKRAGVNDTQRLGMISALEVERFVIGTVDADDLVLVHADPNASRRGAALVSAAVDNDVETAMSAVRLVEGEHPLLPTVAKMVSLGPTGPRRWGGSARAVRLNPPTTTTRVPTAAHPDNLRRANMGESPSRLSSGTS